MESTVSKTERPAYLANVLSIAKADQEFTPHEATVFKAIAERIGAGQQDVDRAWKLHQNGAHDLRFMHEPKIRMANMQDMITMALADGGVGKEESAPIEKLAGTLKYSQADMDIMVRRAELAVRKLADQIAEATAEPKTPAPEYVPPEPLSEAPEPAADREPQKQKEDEPAEHQAPRRKPSAIKPYTVKAVTPSPHTNAPADVAACVSARGAAAHPCEHCFGLGSSKRNVWGCRLLNMDWIPEADWLSHGHFRQDDTFVHDRDAVARQVHARLPSVRHCPHINEAYIAEVLEVLPRLSNVWGHWSYRPAPATDVHAHHLLGQRRDPRGRIQSNPMAVSGLDPVGTREAIKVIRRALRRAQRHDINVRLLR